MEERAKSIPSLIKSYQSEIDSLTMRARSAEKSYMHLFKDLFEAVDPVPALTAALDQASVVADLRSDNEALQRDNEELQEELSALQNQDITIRNLQERVMNFEQELEDKVRACKEAKCRGCKAL